MDKLLRFEKKYRIIQIDKQGIPSATLIFKHENKLFDFRS